MNSADKTNTHDGDKKFPISNYDHVWVVKNFKKAKISSLESSVISKILSKYIPKKDIKIIKDPNGKPLPLPRKDQLLHINISHSHDMLVLIVSIEDRVGIDIEYVKQRAFASRIISRYFGKNEKFKGWKDFYRNWTAREAFVKALGITISRYFFRIKIDGDDVLTIGLDNAFSHRVEFFYVDENYVGAVCRSFWSNNALVFFNYHP